MRLLHTSDWHLGQTFFGESRTPEHRVFLDALVSLCVSEAPDALLICGDVFDSTNPPADAEELWFGFLAKLAQVRPDLGVHVIAGNHDSPARLGAPRPVIERMGIFVQERVHYLERGLHGSEASSRRLDPLAHLRLLPSTSGTQICLGLVPFLRPSDIPPAFGIDGERPLQEFLLGLYSDLAADAATTYPGVPLVLTGHLFAAGGSLSELSERKIQRGNLEALPVETLSARCCYFALGHLHRAQALGPSKNVRYCGSPLPLSFTETHYEHQVVRVDICPLGTANATSLVLARPRRFVRLPEMPALPDAVLAACDALDVDPNELPPFVEARVSLRGPEPGLRQEIDKRLRAKGALLVQYSAVRQPPALGLSPQLNAQGSRSDGSENGSENGSEKTRSSLHDFSALEIFERCYLADYGTTPDDELRSSFLDCVERAQAGDTQSASAAIEGPQ
jgi:DNA repair protein SbcD/Mre11